MVKFIAPPLSSVQLIEKLEGKGLLIKNVTLASQGLNTIGYHRLSAYFKPFFDPDHKCFKAGTTFLDLLKLYAFDKELRLVVTDALETIEVTLRAQISDVMSLKYGSHWYTNPNNFNAAKFFTNFQAELEHISKNHNHEAFLAQYYKNYTEPKLPPSWMIIQCLLFSTLIALLKNILAIKDRKAICKIFGQPPVVMDSWLNSLRYTRNICAHHARLWDRWFVIAPKYLYNEVSNYKIRSFYAQAYIIFKLLRAIDPIKALEWQVKLFNLFEKYLEVPIAQTGFHENWQQDPFWENVTSEQKCRE